LFARVTGFQAPLDRVEESTRYVEEELVPAYRQEQGFRAWYSMVDAHTGKGLTITFWESDEALHASETLRSLVVQTLMRDLGLTIQSTDTYEVTVAFRT
jgi:hypothetical protein